MGLFSKEECCICSNKVGALSRFKIKSGEFMCSDCQKNGSPFIHLAYMTKDQIIALFEETKQDEAYFQANKVYFRMIERTNISKTWTIYDNFQKGEFVLDVPETKYYPNHFIFKMDQVFPYEKSDQFLSGMSAGSGSIEETKKKYYNMISVKENKNSEGKTDSWVLKFPYNKEFMDVQIKIPGSMAEGDVRLLQSTLQALIGSYNTDKRLTPTELQEIQKSGKALGDDSAVTSTVDLINGLFK